jgi:hypothetical protein
MEHINVLLAFLSWLSDEETLLLNLLLHQVSQIRFSCKLFSSKLTDLGQDIKGILVLDVLLFD